MERVTPQALWAPREFEFFSAPASSWVAKVVSPLSPERRAEVRRQGQGPSSLLFDIRGGSETIAHRPMWRQSGCQERSVKKQTVRALLGAGFPVVVVET